MGKEFSRFDRSEGPLDMGDPDLHLDLRIGRSHRELRVVVRQMVDRDADEIHEIHCACLTRTLASHYTQEQIAAWMKGRTPAGYINAANGGENFFVAEADGRVIGFASWQDSELLSLFVHPDSQGLGVGSLLLDACRKDAAAESAGITCLKAAAGADQFYARRGFVPVGQGCTIKNGEVIQDTRMVLPELAPNLKTGR
ncbi:N-acetyltransferase family protein [Pleomorphomonas sp. PLEO]|uniref:GNAT family N-acetyltransferase n=1 Tax=Pleomorphomonas sp. PLEO TaxID=3239306 RepID=UPI00351E9DEE